MAGRNRWRIVLRALHRDLGYLLAALTVAYAISGVAVNHAKDWNPNYSITQGNVDVGPLPKGGLNAWEAHVVKQLKLEKNEVRGRIQPSRTHFTVFLQEGGEVKVQIADGRGRIKRVKPRKGLFELNMLHLNHLKGAWTWAADIFAILLAFLALSGLFMIKGRKGFSGRGKWFVLAGLAIPVGVIVVYYATR
jgi:uncharacterized protein